MTLHGDSIRFGFTVEISYELRRDTTARLAYMSSISLSQSTVSFHAPKVSLSAARRSSSERGRSDSTVSFTCAPSWRLRGAAGFRTPSEYVAVVCWSIEREYLSAGYLVTHRVYVFGANAYLRLHPLSDSSICSTSCRASPFSRMARRVFWEKPPDFDADTVMVTVTSPPSSVRLRIISF